MSQKFTPRNGPFRAVIEFKNDKGLAAFYSYFETVQAAKDYIAEYWKSVLKPVGGLKSYTISELQHKEIEQ